MAKKDYYAILGVAKEATLEEIKAAYRVLVRRFHPDVNPDNPHAAEVTASINEAFDVLSDPEKRAMYDNGADTSGVGLAEEAKAVFLRLFKDIIDNMASAPMGYDPVKTMHSTLAANLDKFKAQQARAEKAIKQLSKTRARVKTPEGKANLAHEVIDNLLDGLNKTIEDAKHAQLVHAELVKLAEGYTFEPEVMDLDAGTKTMLLGRRGFLYYEGPAA